MGEQFVTTGSNDLDNSIEGFHKHNINLIYSETNKGMIYTWCDRISNLHDTAIISTKRPNMLIDNTTQAKYIVGLDSVTKSITNTIIENKHILKNDVIIIESDSIKNPTKLYNITEENDITIIIISTNPSESICNLSTVILKNHYKYGFEEGKFRLIVERHMVVGIKHSMVFDLKYEPNLSVNKVHRISKN